MKTERDELLDAILQDDNGGEFAIQVLDCTLRRVRFRRRARKWRGAAVCLGAAALAVAILWRQNFPKDRSSSKVVAVPQHRAGASAGNALLLEIVRTTPDAIRMVHTMPNAAGIISSKDVDADVKYLSDDALLALFPNRPIALVGAGPSDKTLIFLDAERQE